MTTKNRFLLNRKRNEDLCISWSSSSDSDTQDTLIKDTEESVDLSPKHRIEITFFNDDLNSSTDVDVISTTCNSPSTPQTPTPTISEHSSPTRINLTPVNMSPIISKRKYDVKLSPTLNTYNKRKFNNHIERLKLLKTAKLIKTAKSYEIVDNSDSSTSCTIDSISERDINVASICSSNNSSEDATVSSNLPHITKIRRKHYKKDTLPFVVQEAITKQKNDFTMFRHELYVNPKNVLEKECIILIISKVKKEFGITVLECKFDQDEQKTIIFKNDKQVNSENCLVLIGHNVTHKLCLNQLSKIQLFLPYMKKIFRYNGENLCCYFNVSNIINYKRRLN